MLHVNMFDLVSGFSRMLDMVSTTLSSHHTRTGYAAARIAALLGLADHARNQVLIAAMLHDVGVIPLRDKIDDLLFEQDMERHSRAGYLLLRTCPLLAEVSTIVRYHHTDWRLFPRLPDEDQALAQLANVVHLADFIDVTLRQKNTKAAVVTAMREAAQYFAPHHLEAAVCMLEHPDFLDELEQPERHFLPAPTADMFLDAWGVTAFSLVFAHVIDARSPFTATHSLGVAHIARCLHQYAGQPQREQQPMFIAGLLHDIGKMGVPLDLIERPGPLSHLEMNIVRTHAALSLDVLQGIRGLETIGIWGASHHERMDGRGYPTGVRSGTLPIEARIMAVADVLTAITEDRPYRKGMELVKALQVLDSMVANKGLDPDIVAVAREHIRAIDMTRRDAQDQSGRFLRQLASTIQEAVA